MNAFEVQEAIPLRVVEQWNRKRTGGDGGEKRMVNEVHLDERFYQQMYAERAKMSFTINEDQTLMNLIRGMVGTGLLALPEAFYNAGVWCAFFFTIFTNLVNVYCVHLLVRSAHKLCAISKRLTLDYGEVAQLSFQYSRFPVKKYGSLFRKLVNISLAVTQFGICGVFFIFIAENIRQGIDLQGRFSVSAYMAFVLPVILLLCSIRQMKYLTIPSVIANILYLFGLMITFQYMFRAFPRSMVHVRAVNLSGLPLSFGCIMFSFSAACLALPMENTCRSPQNFISWNGVVNTACTIVTALYLAVGFYGYIRFGNDIAPSITLNLPMDEPLYQAVKVIIAVTVILSYPVQFYIPMDVLLRRIEEKYKHNGKLFFLVEYSVRYTLVLMTFALAELVPQLGLFLSLVGSLTASALAFIFPPIIDAACCYNGSPREWTWVLLSAKSLFLCAFGLLGMLIGSGTAFMAIINSFSSAKE